LRARVPVDGVVIGRALRDIAAGSWVHERLLQMPAARSLEGLPMATAGAPPAPPLEGYTFEGYRNADGSVGTRNLLAIATTVQCVAGVLDVALQRIRAELPSLARFFQADAYVLAKLMAAAQSLLNEVREDPSHPLRAELRGLVLGRFEDFLASAAERLRGDEAFRARLNRWLATRAGVLTETYKHEVAAFVSAQVKSWDARRAVRSIELAIGKDLQYIRVNGTLVGGLLFGKPLLGIVFDSVFHLREEGWRKLTWRWALFFFALAILNEIVWRTQSTDFWVNFKLFGVVPLTFVFAALQYPLLSKFSVDKKS